jgi:SAM-dependent methyltransferase
MSPDYGGYNDLPFVAQFYDPVYDSLERRDVQFYVDCAVKSGGPVLELGCGTGRVLIPTAQAGCKITGLDVSLYMLDRCREKLAAQPQDVRSRVRLVQADMTAFDTGEKYALITIPFRPFQHLITVPEQKACLTCVQKHLAPGGRLVFDVYYPYLPALVDPKYLMEMQVDPEITLDDGRILRRTSRIAAFHRAEQYNDVELIHYVKYPDGRQERLLHAFKMRYFYRFEMEHLLALAGFEVVEFFGNFDRSPFTAESPEMIFVAGKV